MNISTGAATRHADKLPPLIRALFNPACYDHAIGPVQLIETHISWVLLTGEYAYKIKKPLDLGFLDFSALTLRQHACADEVRLNRRLAAEIYLGVIAITGTADSPQINGTGEAIEYAVKMRQFPPDATLDQLNERGELNYTQIDPLAARLAQFHLHECDTATADSPWGEPDTIAQPVMENFQILVNLLNDPVEQQHIAILKDWSITEHQRLSPLMRERKRKGMVRECHGDLHLGNLAWVNGQLIIFDCLEFSPALRWIDVISEVAFCFMDLLHRQRRELAMRFLNAWLEVSGDYEGMALLRYYAVYRAMVRAKVAALRADQSSGDEAGTCTSEMLGCLQLAMQLSQTTPLQLWITHGLSGSGKTTLSQSLLQNHGMIRLRSDVERKRLAGLEASARSGGNINEGLYSQDTSRHTYAHLAQLAEVLLDADWPVIVDAAFLARWQRDLFRNIAQRRGIPFQILDIHTYPATLRERISKRTAQGTDASDADLLVLQHQIETVQPLETDELPFAKQLSGLVG